VAHEPGCSASQGKTNAGHNLGIAEGIHRTFARGTKTVAGTPIPGREGILVQKLAVQDTTNPKVAVLPTRRSLSHPSSGHTHNTNPAQPVQDTCSAGARKAGRSSKPPAPLVEIEAATKVSSLGEWEDGCSDQGEVGSNSLADIPNRMVSPPGVQ